MRQVFKYILVLFLVLSCNNNSIEKPKKPKNLINKNKMVDIIYDMSIFTAAKGINKKLIENNGIFPENYIFSKHNVDSLQFAKSSEYYAYRLDVYEDIYNEVKLKLDERKLYFDSIFSAEADQKRLESELKRTKRDSLKNAKLLEKETKPIPKIKRNLVKELNSSVNLFDESEIVDGEYVDNVGIIREAAGWGRTGYIKVIPGISYTISGIKGRHGLAFYTDENATAILDTFNGSVSLPFTITAPENAEYCVFNLYSPADLVYTNVQFKIGD